MNNRFKDLWFKISVAVFGITALVSVGLLAMVLLLNMLPMKYLAVVILAVVFALFIAFLFLFLLPVDKKFKPVKEAKNRKTYNIIGIVLAACMIIGELVGISMLGKLRGTITEVTGGQEVITEVVSVYVLMTDDAQTLEDAAGYEFAYTNTFDKEFTPQAIEQIKEELGGKMKLKEYESVTTMVDDLLSGHVDAMILNNSYMTILESQEGYEDISTKIRSIHDCTFEVVVKTEAEAETPIDVTKDVFVVYISGNDTDYTAANVRSDVNILAVVNPTTKQVLLINTPRDFYLEISESKDGEYDKLTHCGAYGIDCSMDSLGTLYGRDVRYYAQLSFKGFTHLIDALGGISVYSDANFYAAESDTYVKKGTNFFNGEQALGFVRERHALPDGDLARGRHQMAVITAIIEKCSSGAILTNYGDVLDSMTGCFGTNLTDEEISSLAKMQLDDLATWDVKSFAVTGEGAMKPTYTVPDSDLYVIEADEGSVEHAKMLIEKIYKGETITEEDLVYTP